MSSNYPMRRSTSGTKPRSHEPVDGVHAGLMNLDDVYPARQRRGILCGPIPFMQAVRSALIERGIPPADIQYEVFGPDLWQADSTESLLARSSESAFPDAGHDSVAAARSRQRHALSDRQTECSGVVAAWRRFRPNQPCGPL